MLGAPELVLANVLVDDSVQSKITAYTGGEYRVLFLAYAKAEASSTLTDNKLPQDLTRVALVLLMERIRADAAETLRYFAAQGVVVKIMSGGSFHHGRRGG